MSLRQSISDSSFSQNTSQSEELFDLHKACRIGDLQAIKRSLQLFKQSINERDEKLGWAPLYRTVICGHVEATKLLLENGADCNVKNHLGESCLHQAADNSQYEIARILLENGANPDLQQNDGDTPLHHAAFRGDLEMIKILLSFKANSNIQNVVFGRTPFHYAIDCNHIEAVKIMLKHNANIFIKDRQGKSAFDLTNNNEIKGLLKKIFIFDKVEIESTTDTKPFTLYEQSKLQEKNNLQHQVYDQQCQITQEQVADQKEDTFQKTEESFKEESSQYSQTNHFDVISQQDLSGTGQCISFIKEEDSKEENYEEKQSDQIQESIIKDQEFESLILSESQDLYEISQSEDLNQEENNQNPKINQMTEGSQFDKQLDSESVFFNDPSHSIQSELSFITSQTQKDTSIVSKGNESEVKLVQKKIQDSIEVNSKAIEAYQSQKQKSQKTPFSPQ